MCSIAASMATMAFNNFFADEALTYILKNDKRIEVGYSKTLALAERSENLTDYEKILMRAIEKGAMFDARCFNIPKEEACNLVYWRQLDATRNSIQMVGQANFSHNELQGKSCNMIQDMLHEQRGINWNDYPIRWKRGVAWTRHGGIDYDMPILKGENREYVETVIYPEVEE